MRPLIYLELRQFINGVKAVTRSPKRLIPAVIMAAWIAAVLAQDTLSALRISRPIVPSGFVLHETPPVGLLHAAIFIMLTITAGGIIYTALSEGLLIFAPAHIDFLFPTPVPRRRVLAFKLLRDYLKYALYTGMVFAAIGSPLYHVLNVPLYPEIIISWVGTLLLIVLVMNVTHTLNIVATAGSRRLRIAKLALQLVVAVLIVGFLFSSVVGLAGKPDPVRSVIAAVQSSFARYLLAPIGWATDIILVPLSGVVNEREELFWLFLLAAGSTALLLSRHEDIYEPSLGISARIAGMKRAMREGNTIAARIHAMGWKGRGSFSAPPVPPFGRGALSLLWKNLVVRIRTSGRSLVAITLLPVAIAAVIGSMVHEREIREAVPLALPYIAWVFALMGQQELRGELRQANLTKAMPVSARTAMAAQVLYEWLPILLVVTVSAVSLRQFVPDADRYLLVLCAVAAVGFGYSCVSVISIPVLLYPDSRDKMQDIITHAISFLLAGVVIMPSAGAVFVGKLLRVDLTLVAVILIVVNAAISACATLILGAMYSRFDPTSD